MKKEIVRYLIKVFAYSIVVSLMIKFIPYRVTNLYYSY